MWCASCASAAETPRDKAGNYLRIMRSAHETSLSGRCQPLLTGHHPPANASNRRVGDAKAASDFPIA
jgi:hypothetical protein